MKLRQATVNDLEAVRNLEFEAFAPLDRWSESSWLEELSLSRHAVVLEDDGRVVAVATFRTVADTCDLNRIIVAVAYRGQRLASQLIASGLEHARRRGASRMLLEVASDNTSAIACYARHGFMEIARREDYYGSGVDALIMEVSLD